MDDCKAASQAYQSQHVLDDVKVCSTSKLAYYYSNEQSCSYISRPPHNAKAQQQFVTITIILQTQIAFTVKRRF